MAKPSKVTYVCQSCGYQTLKWMGRCPDCGQWNSMVEEAVGPVEDKDLFHEPARGHQFHLPLSGDAVHDRAFRV